MLVFTAGFSKVTDTYGKEKLRKYFFKGEKSNLAHETFPLFTWYNIHQRRTPISGGRELQGRAAVARIPLTGTPDTDPPTHHPPLLLIFLLRARARARDPYYNLLRHWRRR